MDHVALSWSEPLNWGVSFFRGRRLESTIISTHTAASTCIKAAAKKPGRKEQGLGKGSMPLLHFWIFSHVLE
jgi:hypothetical protein